MSSVSTPIDAVPTSSANRCPDWCIVDHTDEPQCSLTSHDNGGVTVSHITNSLTVVAEILDYSGDIDPFVKIGDLHFTPHEARRIANAILAAIRMVEAAAK